MEILNMVKCINCGVTIDTDNPLEIFYTKKVGIYECQKCHNADLNIEYKEESNKLSIIEIVVLVISTIIIALILYFVLFQ
jgi:hypothetical protein